MNDRRGGGVRNFFHTEATDRGSWNWSIGFEKSTRVHINVSISSSTICVVADAHGVGVDLATSVSCLVRILENFAMWITDQTSARLHFILIA